MSLKGMKMFDDESSVLMNECYADSLEGRFTVLSALEGSYITKLKNLSKIGLLEIRGPSHSGYGVSFEAKMTASGIAKYRAYLKACGKE